MRAVRLSSTARGTGLPPGSGGDGGGPASRLDSLAPRSVGAFPTGDAEGPGRRFPWGPSLGAGAQMACGAPAAGPLVGSLRRQRPPGACVVSTAGFLAHCAPVL